MKIISTTNIDDQVYKDAIKIRRDVFIVEQNVPVELEVDDLENQCQHYVGYVDEQPVVTARTHLTDENTLHIQRVATIKSKRGQGFAAELLKHIEQVAAQQNIDTLELGAQDQAQDFYLKLGYEVVGPQFLDAGIQHHNMKKAVR